MGRRKRTLSCRKPSGGVSPRHPNQGRGRRGRGRGRRGRGRGRRGRGRGRRGRGRGRRALKTFRRALRGAYVPPVQTTPHIPRHPLLITLISPWGREGATVQLNLIPMWDGIRTCWNRTRTDKTPQLVRWGLTP